MLRRAPSTVLVPITLALGLLLTAACDTTAGARGMDPVSAPHTASSSSPFK